MRIPHPVSPLSIIMRKISFGYGVAFMYSYG